MSCQFAHFDGSYVLGALSPADRQEFEQHVNECPQCAQSVRELAGLPGLLSRLDAEILESAPRNGPVPEALLHSVVREARRTQRRRAFVTAAVATAAAVTVAVIGSQAVTGMLDGAGRPAAGTQPSATVSNPVGQAMVRVGQGPVQASLAFESVPWGTRLDLTCSYASPESDRYEQPHPAMYALIIRTRDGRTEQVATWRAVTGRTMRLSAATAASRTDIALAEVRAANGEAILRLNT